MLIRITNLTRSQISLLNTSIPATSTRSINVEELTSTDRQELENLESAGHITYIVTEDPDVDDRLEEAQVSMINRVVSAITITGPAAPGVASADYSAQWSESVGGLSVAKQAIFNVTVYDPSVADPTKPGPATANATISPATTPIGLILDSFGPSAKVESDTNGRMDFKVTRIGGIPPLPFIIAVEHIGGGPSIGDSTILAIILA